MPPPDLSKFNIFYRSRLWSLIWAYVALIYMTLPVMRFLLQTLRELLGPEGLSLGFNAVLILAACSLMLIAIKRGWRALVLLCIPLGIIGVSAIQLDIPEERVHFLQYGILGILVVFTLRRWSIPLFLIAAVFVAMVGAVDELIQWALPNRVGDLRDVLINTVAGVLGVTMGIILRPPSRSKGPEAQASRSTIS